MLGAVAMDPQLRKALTNLQGAFDEGFLTKPEYNARRKALLDGATTVGSSASVFDRLGSSGPAAAKKAGADGKWSHDGYFEQQGGAGKASITSKLANGRGKAGATLSSLAKPKSDIRKPGKATDLRSIIGGGGQKGQRDTAKPRVPSGKRSLPEKCPW